MRAGTAATRGVPGPSYYDNAYRKDPLYRTAWADGPYATVWRRIAELVPAGAQVLEVGCGPGQLARCLHDLCDLESYVGFDFSAVGIARARQLVPNAVFEVADARRQHSYRHSHNVLIATEVLEHLKDDLGVFRKALAEREGALILFTVPNRNSRGHVRYFPAAADVVTRYGPYVPDLQVEAFEGPGEWRFYLGSGRLAKRPVEESAVGP